MHSRWPHIWDRCARDRSGWGLTCEPLPHTLTARSDNSSTFSPRAIDRVIEPVYCAIANRHGLRGLRTSGAGNSKETSGRAADRSFASLAGLDRSGGKWTRNLPQVAPRSRADTY